ncbi:hypothetical protein [Nevskia sp.]|uniref:hypothetical protein n=1 Tax=Nevskia sp. TaxID=1929292 RepID=UPI003F724601
MQRYLNSSAAIFAALLFFCRPEATLAASSNQNYFGTRFTYSVVETRKSIFGGEIKLLRPSGFDHFGTDHVTEALLIEGAISRETPIAVNNLIKTNPKIKDVYLDSPGGDLFGGILLGQTIHSQGLSTIVYKGECASACALAFLAGSKRLVITPREKFGFHRQYYIVDQKIKYGSWEKDISTIKNYLKSISADFITPEEIVGTTGLVTYTNERLREKEITTQSFDEFYTEIGNYFSSNTGFENYIADCFDRLATGAMFQCSVDFQYLRSNSIFPLRLPEVMLKVAERGVSLQQKNNALDDVYITNLDLLYSEIESQADILRIDCVVFNSEEGHIQQTDYLTGRLKEIADLVRKPDEAIPEPGTPLRFPLEYAKISLAFQQYCDEVKSDGLPKNSVWRPNNRWVYISSALKGTTNEDALRNCGDLTKFTMLVGRRRDEGSTELSMLRIIKDMALSPVQSEVKPLFRAIVRWAFSRKQITPDLLANQIENSCIKSGGYGFYLTY